MTEAEWKVCSAPVQMLRALESPYSKRKKRLFGCACCRRVWHLIPDDRSRTAVEVAERFADGAASDEELATAARQASAAISKHRRYVRGSDESEERYSGTAACSHVVGTDVKYFTWAWHDDAQTALDAGAKWHNELAATCALIRDIFGNPFRSVDFSSEWQTDTAIQLAKQMYESRDFSLM